jgi:hypothetical protein
LSVSLDKPLRDLNLLSLFETSEEINKIGNNFLLMFKIPKITLTGSYTKNRPCMYMHWTKQVDEFSHWNSNGGIYPLGRHGMQGNKVGSFGTTIIIYIFHPCVLLAMVCFIISRFSIFFCSFGPMSKSNVSMSITQLHINIPMALLSFPIIIIHQHRWYIGILL